ncbi:hypothetical protein BGZ58_002834 [Dissophora ornata]|nr:hypothetical protein BGZ58_002834 [Dissophora ornata]
MPASLLARVKISPSILLKDQKEEKEHEDLSFVLSWRKEILITADKFNAPESVEKALNHLRKKEIESFMRNASREDTHCKVKILPLSTFPKLTGHDNRLCFVYLLEKIMHTIFVANQYDVSCEHGNPWRDRTTHTEFFWFKAVPGDNAPYERTKYEILKLIENIATPWMEVLMDLEHKFYGRLRGLGDELVDAIQVSLVMYLDITRIEQWLPNPSSPPTDHKPEKDLDKWWTEALT